MGIAKFWVCRMAWNPGMDYWWYLEYATTSWVWPHMQIHVSLQQCGWSWQTWLVTLFWFDDILYLWLCSAHAIGLIWYVICCVFRPHRGTTYVDAAYFYRPSSVVCQSVTLVSPAKTAAPIELPFGLRTWVGPENHVLDAGPDPACEGANFGGEWASHCKV